MRENRGKGIKDGNTFRIILPTETVENEGLKEDEEITIYLREKTDKTL